MSNLDKLSSLYKQANSLNEECSVEFCNLNKYSKGYCQSHYHSFWKYGNPLFLKKKNKPNNKINFVEDENGCFNCTSHHFDKGGYARMMHNRKHVSVHRFIYMQMFGEIPKGLIIRHKCDNPPCINPEHLLLGTHKDNMQDKMDRGRHKVARKFNKEQVTLIRNRIKKGDKLKDIASDYKVDPGTISNMKRGVYYRE